jgi:putative ABC transport system permease protein
VQRVAFGSVVPWRDAQNGGGNSFNFRIEGMGGEGGLDDPRGRFRSVSPGFFAALGIPVLAGRDFDASDTADAERVVIVSASVAEQLMPGQEVLNRRLVWTDPLMKFINISTEPRRIVGVVADVDDERITPAPAMTVYHPFEQQVAGGRLFVHANVDPYTLVPGITRIVRELANDQPVERAATLDDVRAEVLAPDRLNTLVFGGFAAVALIISIVGVAGVLAFSVSSRIREFGIRMAIGSQPTSILAGVLVQGLIIAAAGVIVGGVGGFALARVLASYVAEVRLPGLLPVAGAATVLLIAALVASVVPAARAARIDVIRALRTE